MGSNRGFLKEEKGVFQIDYKKTTSIFINYLNLDIILNYKSLFRGKLLDAGCGEKPYSLIYDSLVKESVGVDVETCVHEQKFVDVFSSIEELPFADGAFDCVLCTNVLEHVKNIDSACRELSRVLKKEGNIILIAPFLYPTHEAPYDFYRFTRYGLMNMLETHGIKAQHIHSAGGPLILFFVWFNLFLCNIIKNKLIKSFSCRMQVFAYKIWKRFHFNKMLNNQNKLNDLISLGYIVIGEKL